MNKNIKEIKINVGSRDIYLTFEECLLVKEVLDSLDLTRSEIKVSSGDESFMKSLQELYKSEAPPKTMNEYIGKWYDNDKVDKPTPMLYPYCYENL